MNQLYMDHFRSYPSFAEGIDGVDDASIWFYHVLSTCHGKVSLIQPLALETIVWYTGRYLQLSSKLTYTPIFRDDHQSILQKGFTYHVRIQMLQPSFTTILGMVCINICSMETPWLSAPFEQDESPWTYIVKSEHQKNSPIGPWSF